jgi:LmbE family N-acetylglucosaminyl deacetylase
MLIDPSKLFPGTLLIFVPHMDDCVLGCGGIVALLPQKERIHLVYATDGMKAPAPAMPWRDSVSADLGEVRKAEARAALGYLGVPEGNLRFLDLPEGQLKQHIGSLRRLLGQAITEIRPDHVFVPFRYDRHLDHLAMNQVVTAAHREGRWRGDLIEYFVYHRWQLLPGRDVRGYIDPRHLFSIDISRVSANKRTALDHFKSQTTRYYSWQARPNLMPWLLDDESQRPEFFLKYDPSFPGATVFTRRVLWIRLVHRLEPILKRWKDRAVASVRRGL